MCIQSHVKTRIYSPFCGKNQRLATATLESRLSAQTAASESAELALKKHISELEAREASRVAKAEEELRVARAQSEDAAQKLQEANTRLSDMRATAKSSLDQIRNKLSTLIYRHLLVLTFIQPRRSASSSHGSQIRL